MKRKTYIFAGIAAIILVAFFIAYREFMPEKVNSKTNIKDSKNEVDEYYVPVTGYWSALEDLSMAELKSKMTKVEKGEKDNIKKMVGDIGREVSEITSEDLGAGLSENEIAIVKWSSVAPNLKTLSVDGKFIWDKNSVTDYPLKLNIESQGKKEIFDPNKVTKIVAGGDVMLSRHVATKIRSLGDLAPWQKVANFLKDADITFVNLEVPLSDLFPTPTQGMSFIAPAKYAAGLIFSGIDIVSVANNHTANFGQKVFEDNLATLNKNNVLSCGGGMNDVEARTPKVINKNGTKFAFLCYNAITGGLSADANSGVAHLAIEPWYRDDEESIKKLESDVKKVKKISDVVILSPHWGVEYKLNPNTSQQKVARRAIDAGADLILGTHPHVVQGSEFRSGKYITYSLGNLVFDQEWSTETKQGTILENYFYGNKPVSAKLVPVQIEDYYQPRFVTGGIASQIMDRIKSASLGF